MQPQYPSQPQFPPAPQQPYPNQQPPPAYPPQAYPPQPPQGYPPQAPPGYPPPQYAQAPQGYAQPMPPVAAPSIPGTLDQFYAQPSTGGGKSLSFEQPGTSYIGIVTRPITNGDIEQQTNLQSGAPATFKDGRPKFVMKVPLQMQPSAAYPDGLAQWYCRGAARDDLVRAMAEAGAPEGPPEAGAVITITMTGTRPGSAGMNPTKLFRVQYQRPQGAAPAAAPATPPPAAAQPVPPVAYQPAPPPVYATNGAPNGTATTTGPAVMTINQPPPAPVYAPPPTPVAAAPAELSPEQQALLATLTGQVQPTH